MADQLYDLTTSLLSFEAQPGLDPSYLLDRAAQSGQWSPFNGTTQLSSAWSKFGTRSLALANTNDGIVRNDSRVVAFGDRPICIEGWINADSSQPADYPVVFAAYPFTNRSWQAGAIALICDHPVAPGKLTLHIYNAGSSLISCTTTVVGAGAIHFAVTRDASSVWRIFINGSQQDSFTFTGSVNEVGSTTNTAVLGSDGLGGSSDFRGYIDEFRITIGDPRYVANFTPSTVPFEFVEFGAAARSIEAARQLPIGTIPAVPGALAIDPKPLRRDAYFTGDGQIVGTVKQKSTPANTPLRRKVLLLDETTNIVMRETWSDAVTGAYAFSHIDRFRRYSVITFDYTNNYRAVIADNLLAEAM